METQFPRSNVASPPMSKNPGFAWLVSLVLPGSGQLYCGKINRGAWTMAFFTLTGLGVIFIDRTIPYWGVVFRACLVLYAFSFLDAYFTAREINTGCDRPLYQNPRVAAVLNLLTRGFGYFYLGQRKKGLLVFIGLGVIGAAGSIRAVGVGLEVLLVGIAIDAYRIANRESKPGSGNVFLDSSTVLQLGLAVPPPPPASEPLPPPPTEASPQRAPGLRPAIPVGLACLIGLAYFGLIGLGLAMPNYRVVDQSQAKIIVDGPEKIYTNPRYGVEIHIPAEWNFDESNRRYFIQASGFGGACHVVFMADPSVPFASLESQAAAVADQLLNQNRDFRLLGRKATNLGSLPSQEVSFSGHVQGIEVVQYYLLATKGLTLYALVTTAPNAVAEYCHAEVEGIRGSVRFTR